MSADAAPAPTALRGGVCLLNLLCCWCARLQEASPEKNAATRSQLLAQRKHERAHFFDKYDLDGDGVVRTLNNPLDAEHARLDRGCARVC